jgi:hypothetical protein
MRTSLVSAVVLSGLLGVAEPVVADPITVWFQVDLTTRLDYTTGQTQSIDPIGFAVRLTFDDGITFSTSTPTSLQVAFGAASFAGLPPLTGAGGAFTQNFGGSTVIGHNWGFSDLPHYTFAEARQETWGQNAPVDATIQGTQYFRLYNFRYQNLADPSATPTPEELLTLFASGYAVFTSWAQHIDSGAFEPNSFDLTGTFTRLDVEPVPEPATLVLVGAGLAGVALRKRRSRHATKTKVAKLTHRGTETLDLLD